MLQNQHTVVSTLEDNVELVGGLRQLCSFSIGYCLHHVIALKKRNLRCVCSGVAYFCVRVTVLIWRKSVNIDVEYMVCLPI